MSDIAIQLHQVTKRYPIGARRATTLREQLSMSWQQMLKRPAARGQAANTILALNNLSFALRQGEVLGVVGANGSGKSTLLRILSKITAPTSGWLGINGRIGSLLGIGTGFSPDMTGRENIFLSGAVLGLKRSEIQRKFEEIVDFSEIGKFLDTPVKYYSSGMYVRLAFAVAVNLTAEILLLDEVLAVGDAAFHKKSLARMKETVQLEGRTIVLVSHDRNMVASLCTRCLYLQEGALVAEGEPATVLAQYAQDQNESQITPPKAKSYSGSGQALVTGIQFLSPSSSAPLSNANRSNAKVGEDLVIEVQYQSQAGSQADLLEVTIGLSFFNQWGAFVTVANSAMASQNFAQLPPAGKIYCSIPRLPLMPGTYRVAATLAVQGKIAFAQEEAATLHVEDGDYYKTGYTHMNAYQLQGVYIEHQWFTNAAAHFLAGAE